MAPQTSGYHILYFFAQAALHANDYCNESLVWFKVSKSNIKFWTIAETHLGYPVVAESQGDLATGQCIMGEGGQDS